MLLFLSILHYILCIVLILVILLQAGRGSGLTSGGLGGEGTQSLFGTKTSSFMTKVTTIAAIGFLCTCLIIDITSSVKAKSLMTKADKNFELTQELKEKIEELKAKQVQENAETQEVVTDVDSNSEQLQKKLKKVVADEAKIVESQAEQVVSKAEGTVDNTLNATKR